MPEYILLLSQPEAKFDHLSPEDIQTFYPVLPLNKKRINVSIDADTNRLYE